MKASRILLLAAAQLCCAGPGGTALAAGALGAWTNLWRTPDQQGQALLDAGQPAQAAQRFRDPRRRAYADLEASNYKEAARLLAPFTDARSEYNYGNALAQSGQLQAALAAYDAALKQAPTDKDIRHNRDLVERALQQQKQRQSSQSSSRGGRQRGKAGGSQGQQPQQSSAGRQGSSGPRQSPGSRQSGGASPQSRAGGSQQGSGGQVASGGSQAGGSRPDSASEAQRDAAFAAAQARAQQQRGATGNTAQGQGEGQQRGQEQKQGADDADSLLTSGGRTPKQKPESEKQMALDQWLRQIPDSPAGLLRRKFLIEHMIRQQQDGEDPQESGQ